MADSVVFSGGSKLEQFFKNAGKGGVDGVDVGYFASAKYDDKNSTPVASVAATHEFGTSDGRIPERATMRPGVKQAQFRLKRLLRQNIDPEKMVVDETLAGKLGLTLQNTIQRKIRDLRTPINAESTVKAKGSSNPLIDTGLMIDSVTYEVNK